MLPRRELLKLGALAAAGGVVGCGDDTSSTVTDDNVLHLLSTASSNRILLKASFVEPPSDTPELVVDGARVMGQATDTNGEFFVFDAAGLDPDREHRLELRVGRTFQIEPWTLRTLPDRAASPQRLRILAFTCAGGHEQMPIHVTTAVRRRMLQRALSFAPDVVVANGDHVYWDLTLGLSARILGDSPTARDIAGTFDRSIPVLGTENEEVLKRAVDNQIAELYGTLFRSVPVFFLRDDHDYFENDEYREGPPVELTFPPDAFSVELARATQWLYYPELIVDAEQPSNMTGAGTADRPVGVNEAFGALRYGRLFEGLLYDCKGFLSLGGDSATFLPSDVESWLMTRMRDSDATHLLNMPSSPAAYTAGKYAEWYPDVLIGDELTIDVPKPGWQSGWLKQHDRILSAASAMERIPLFVSGDIHSHAEARILRSGEADLSSNPVISLVTGTPGTKGFGWPSSFRGTRAMPSKVLDVEEQLPALEENGFNIIEVEQDRITVKSFRFDGENGDPAVLDTLEPFRESVFERA
jgi:phosphodiesterase/alkaline phosphatase D-like protein